MSTDIILFLLRLVAGLLLLSLLVALYVIIWRDYRSAMHQFDATRRIYGQLVEMTRIDDDWILTGKQYPLLPLTSLGRSPTNSIVINDTFASSEHAVVALRDNQWWLEDRDSRNGTTLNDIPITEPVVITHADIIGIGGTCFRCELEH